MKLELQHLSKRYRERYAVRDVNVTLTPGVYGLLGANGAGKTTLMGVEAVLRRHPMERKAY